MTEVFNAMNELTWKAVYANDSFLTQFEKDGKENKYPDIDRTKLIAFELYKDETLIFKMDLEKDMKLVCRRRTAKRNDGKIEVVYIVGWHRLIEGKGEKKIAFIFGDGRVEFKSDWEDNNEWEATEQNKEDIKVNWYGKVNLMECEK